jgi:hypothetical protein
MPLCSDHESGDGKTHGQVCCASTSPASTGCERRASWRRAWCSRSSRACTSTTTSSTRAWPTRSRCAVWRTCGAACLCGRNGCAGNRRTNTEEPHGLGQAPFLVKERIAGLRGFGGVRIEDVVAVTVRCPQIAAGSRQARHPGGLSPLAAKQRLPCDGVGVVLLCGYAGDGFRAADHGSSRCRACGGHLPGWSLRSRHREGVTADFTMTSTTALLTYSLLIVAALPLP